MFKKLVSAFISSIVITVAGLSASAADKVTISLLVDNGPSSIKSMEAVTKAFMAKYPHITVETEIRPGGGDGDNIVKTRLATGEMADVFTYNSGSLFSAMHPQETLLDLTDEPFQKNVIESFYSVVSENGRIYGAPMTTAMGGGIFYNRKIYAELGLKIPKTWKQFMANNEKIKKAGKVAVAGTFKDSWTSQIFLLADYFNVQVIEPDFAQRYTNNQAKYATTPAAMRGFKMLEEVYKAGYMNKDFGAAGYNDGLRMVATGEAAHYPMLTFAIGSIQSNYPKYINDVGVFAVPGTDASKNGLTVWMPHGIYIPKNTKHPKEAKMFVAFHASVEGCNAITEAVGATGPYLIKGCKLPKTVPPAVADLLPYFQAGGMNSPALEFLSPIKGPALEQITVEVGSGIISAAEGAALYDKDVRKQALQLGLDW